MVVVFPEPLIPMKTIMKGDFTSSEFLMVLMKSGGLMRIDSIAFFSSSERLISFRVLPISFSSRDFLIASTDSYATLFCRRIISSSSKSSLNFSSVSLFLNFMKNSFLAGVLIVSVTDCSNLSFCFLGALIFLVLFFFEGCFLFSVSTGASLFFFIHFFNFSFNVPNIFSRGNSIL